MNQDYKLTIQAFFASVQLHIDEMKVLYEDKDVKKHISEIQNKVKSVEKLIFELIKLREDKPKDNQALMDLQQKIIKANNMEAFSAFSKPGSVDSKALSTYREAVSAIAEYYALPHQDWKKMMGAIKNWNYIKADGLAKKLLCKISPISTFVMKDYTK